MQRPVTTLYLLMSVDGKISTGNIDDRDVDKDFPRIVGIKEGLQQYYDIQIKDQLTDFYSMLSGKTMVKVGVNIKKEKVYKTPVNFIVIDNEPHLNNIGVEYFLQLSKIFYLVTNNKNHPAFSYKDKENICIIYCEGEIDFVKLFEQFKSKYGIEKLIIETGGTLNSVLLRKKLIDKISIIVVPALIGGKETSTLVDGESLQKFEDLEKIKALKLIDLLKLNDSYIHLKYEVINETKIV